MDPAKPFPILRLPFLAIEEVFKVMYPIEIINFSMISKRTKAVTKKMTFYSKYALCLSIEKTLEINFSGIKNLIFCTYKITADKHMDGKTVEHKNSDYILRKVYKYAEHPVKRWKVMCKYILEIFKKEKIDVVRMTMDAFVDHNVSIIDFLKTNAKSVDICFLEQTRDVNNVDEHFGYLLENVTVNAKLHSSLNIKNKNISVKIPKNLYDLRIYNSQWIGYERLLQIDSKHVMLGNDEISNEEWNLFLKKWVAMEIHLNLGSLQFSRKELGTFRDHVLHDIPYEVVSEEVSRIVPCFYSFYPKTQKINGGIDIRRIDGKTATFFILRPGWNGSFLMCIH